MLYLKVFVSHPRDVKLPLLACLLMLSAVAFAGTLDDVTIVATRVKTDSKDQRKGSISVSEAEIAYDVKVSNRAFRELTAIILKYNIFYADSEPGSTAKPEVRVAKGDYRIESLKTHGTAEFKTAPIKLATAILDGNRYFLSGAGNVAKDRLLGVWIKAFDAEGRLIGEYMSPQGLSQKREWAD